MGRPSAYKPEYCEQAEKLCLLGAVDSELADFFGVSEQTINKWKKDYPEFLESLKSGKEAADARVADSLYRRAIGFEHPAVKIFNNNGTPLVVDYTEKYAPDTTAAIFWLKNRRPDMWRDAKQIDGQVKHEHSHTHTSAELSDTDRIIADAIARGQERALPKPH